jgi:hypothetical protein
MKDPGPNYPDMYVIERGASRNFNEIFLRQDATLSQRDDITGEEAARGDELTVRGSLE